MQSSRTWDEIGINQSKEAIIEKTSATHRWPVLQILMGSRPVLVEGGKFDDIGARAVVDRLVVALDGLREEGATEFVVSLVLVLDGLLEGGQWFGSGGAIRGSTSAQGGASLVNGHGFTVAIERLLLLLVVGRGGDGAGGLSIVQVAQSQGYGGTQQQGQLPPGEGGSGAARRHGPLLEGIGIG